MAEIDAKTWLETVILNDPTMAAASATDVASQYSIKQYTDQAKTDAMAYTDSELAGLSFATTGYVDAQDSYYDGLASDYAVAAQEGDHAYALANHHDVVINSSVGVELITNQFDFAAVTPTVTSSGALTAPDWVKFADDGGGSTGLWTLAFSPTSEEEILATPVFSSRRIHGSDVIPIVLWTAPTTGTGTQYVSWGLEYFWPSSAAGTIGNTTIISSNVASPTGTLTANQIYATALPNITAPLGGNELDAMWVRVFRDAAGVLNTDDYPNDALFGAVVFYYFINRIGAPLSEL